MNTLLAILVIQLYFSYFWVLSSTYQADRQGTDQLELDFIYENCIQLGENCDDNKQSFKLRLFCHCNF